eukprot:gene30167-40064_t
MKNSSNRKKKDSIGPLNAAPKTTTPKPHIGTVPLFLVKKQPTVRSGFIEPNSAFPAALHSSMDHNITTPSIGTTPYQPFDGGDLIFGVHGVTNHVYSAQVPPLGSEMPAADYGDKDYVVEDIDMFSSDEDDERGRRVTGPGAGNPQNPGKGRSKAAVGAATAGRKRTAPPRSKSTIDEPSIPAKGDSSMAASSHIPRDGASPGPVSLFQMMKLSSMKWSKAALPGNQEPAPIAIDVAATVEMAEGCEEAAGGLDMAPVPPGIAPITQYFKRPDKKPEEAGDSSKRSIESISNHHGNAHVHANKRQKSLIEAWNIRTEHLSPEVAEKRDHQEDANDPGGNPPQKLASPSSRDMVCSPLTLSSGEKKKSSSSSKRGAPAIRVATMGFHTEEFGHLKKLRKPRKSLSAVFKL